VPTRHFTLIGSQRDRLSRRSLSFRHTSPIGDGSSGSRSDGGAFTTAEVIVGHAAIDKLTQPVGIPASLCPAQHIEPLLILVAGEVQLVKGVAAGKVVYRASRPASSL